MIVLDASLIIEWLIGAKTFPIARGLHELLSTDELVVPSHWPVEVGNVLTTHMRGRRLDAERLHGVLDRLDSLSISVAQSVPLDDIGPLANFATANELTAYDAVYVQLALQHKAVLATLDNAMRAAAQRLNIPLLPA